MEIFYANKNKIKYELLAPFYKSEFKSEKRRLEFALSRFILDYVFKNRYKISDYKIEVKNNKPVINNEKIHFSISHSKEYAIVSFDKFPIGADIEYMKDRNFEKLSEYFDKKISDKEEFYKFWTKYEAEYKLQAQGNFFRSFKFMKDYMISVSSSYKIENIDLYEIEDNLCIKKLEL